MGKNERQDLRQRRKADLPDPFNSVADNDTGGKKHENQPKNKQNKKASKSAETMSTLAAKYSSLQKRGKT